MRQVIILLTSQPSFYRDGGGIVCLGNPKDTRVNSPSQVTLIRFVFFRQVLSIGRFRLCLTLGANKRLFGLAHTVVWLYWATVAVVAFCGKRAIHLMAA